MATANWKRLRKAIGKSPSVYRAQASVSPKWVSLATGTATGSMKWVSSAATNNSWIRTATAFDGSDVTATFRNSGDKPLVGDWDGDGDDQIGSWNAGIFYLDQNSNGVWDGAGAGDRRSLSVCPRILRWPAIGMVTAMTTSACTAAMCSIWTPMATVSGTAGRWRSANRIRHRRAIARDRRLGRRRHR